MRTREALDRLYGHHELILAQLERAEVLLRLAPIAAQAPLARSRWEMMRLLRAYQLFKHTEIFDPALANGDPAQRAAATRMKQACIAAGNAFRAHTERWSGTDITRAWKEYRPASASLIVGMRDHLRRERTDIDRLLAGSYSPRRLAPAAKTGDGSGGR